MEKSTGTGVFTARRCNGQIWLVLPISFVLCFVFLSFDYSALSREDNGVRGGVASISETHYPDLPPNSTHKSKSHDSTINQAPPIGRSKTPLEISCSDRYIYVHDLPSKFNSDLLSKCEEITRGTDKNMCPYLGNLGLGPEVENSEGILLNQSWYMTNQFLLEVIFHNRIKNYDCLTNDSSRASAIFVPFYGGLELSKHLWGFNISVRDSLGLALLRWIAGRKEWKRMYGRDHFMVAGRISWDFRRQTDKNSDWGTGFRFFPESRNMSMLSIEASSWNNDHAIPYPTCFHPKKHEEITRWQNMVRLRERSYLFTFAGAPRPEYSDSVRDKIIKQCLAAEKQCKLLECNNYNKATSCDDPVNVMRVFSRSVFCLQPTGDSYTRRSIFDAILAGCIPVFFHPGTAYAQYKWHFPKHHTKYSLYLPVKNATEWSDNLKEILEKISEETVITLREEVIKLIPNVVYTDPRYRVEGVEDAFDLALRGMLERIESVRRMVRGEKDPAMGFADMDDYKFTFDHYKM